MSPPTRGLFSTDDRVRAAYSEGAGIYRILPQAVAIPVDVADLESLVRWAIETRTALTPRGAGSGMGGGNVGEGVVVDLTQLPRRLEVNPAGRYAVTSPSITLAELNQAAAPHNLRLPPDPSSGAWATLGGMVSTNAAGARSIGYGSVRRWVRALEVVTGSGQRARFTRDAATPQPSYLPTLPPGAVAFPQTSKNSSGYALDAYAESGNVLDLFIGSEGTLGFITEIEWALAPVPPVRAGLRITLGSLDHLHDTVAALNRLAPSALELLDRSFLDLVSSSRRTIDMPGIPEGTEVLLLAEFEGKDAKAVRGTVGDAVRLMKGLATDVATAITPEEERRLWELRHAASPILAGLPEDRRSMQVIEDGCVPLPRLGEYIGFIRRAAAERELQVVIFGHAGDGNIHVNLIVELAQPGWRERVASLFEAVNTEVIALGGTVSGEHGVGRLRAGFLERQYGAEVMARFREIKAAFDPYGILNPGIIVGRGDGVSRLKTGPDATPIPPDIAAALRLIERSGGYGRSRLELARDPREQPSTPDRAP